jgi:hypothetical protein
MSGHEEDIVVWDENHWCFWKNIASYGRNRSSQYKVLSYGTSDYINFLEYNRKSA